jgi:transglutaminase-like putative cysteine protease
VIARASLALAIVVAVIAPAHAGRPRVVRGQGGDPHLVLDRGRSLRRVPLGRVRPRPRLSSIEKVRLDARRIFHASRLGEREKVERLVMIVARRIRTERIDDGADRSGQVLSLASAVRTREGTCRERAFLLQGALAEVGVAAEVRYGSVYDRRRGMRNLGPHAWVEARVAGRWMVLDPSAPKSVVRRSRVAFEVDIDGAVTEATGVETRDLLYEYTEPPAVGGL